MAILDRPPSGRRAPLPPRLLSGLVALALLAIAGTGAAAPRRAHAQGVTTAAVRGTIRMSDGSDPAGARVSVLNLATGFVVEAPARNGRFLFQGLEVGGPYRVTVRRIGTRPEQRDIGFLALGEPFRLDLVLTPAPVVLDSLVAVAPSPFPPVNSHGGTSSTLGDSLIHRLPTLNRDLYDFVRLVPQVSTRVGVGSGGLSAGGVNFRLNHFLTNGVPERSLSGGQPPEFAGGKSLPLEAVGEYQVLLAPFDVRYGDFAGAAVNTVTRSGTNRFAGSVFAQYRNDGLARADEGVLPYDRAGFGLSISGPIARDRAHFLVASEFQRLTAPMQGPYVGQPAGAAVPVPVLAADLARLDTILRGYGLTAGSGGAVPNRNPLRNLFARADAALPELRSRAVLWLNDADTESLVFSRGAADGTFELSSRASTTTFHIRTVALQLHTALARAGGGHNEIFLSHRSIRFGGVPAVVQPVVSVAVPAVTGGGVVSVVTGSAPQTRPGNAPQRSINLRDNLTLPLGRSHAVTVGLEAEWFRVETGGLPNSYGSWGFSSLDSITAGLADRFEVARDFGGGSAPLTGAQYAAYAGDQWLVGERVTLTFGVRADALVLRGRPPYNRVVDSVFGLRTDALPSGHVHWSPRAGFTWSPDREGNSRIRGGVGLFTGRPPLAWLHQPLQSYGTGSGSVRCGQIARSQGPVPAFDPDPFDPPTACAGGSGATPPGDVELAAPRLRMARTLRAALAWDRRLPGDILATTEALLTWSRSDFFFANLNLAGPQQVDRFGRVHYGVFAPTGRAQPALRAPELPGAIEVRNVSDNHSAQLAVRLEKRFAAGLAAMASYTWSRVRDVQTPLRVNQRGAVNWSSRAVSGRHEDLRTGISLNDVPHRVVLAGTWRAPWRRWTTELSLLYVGESGSPFTWLAFSPSGLGDLNADGSPGNDPVYVPRSAADPAEIVFTGLSSESGADNSAQAQATRVLAQQAAFERFIAASPCLRRHRGRILARNSCREPWSHLSMLSVRQRLPVSRRGVEVQLDLYNVLNLVDGDWGRRRVAQPALLEHTGQAPGPTGASEPVFRFQEPASPWSVVPAESSFQLQLGVAYRL